MDELANEVGLNAAETDYLTEYFKVVEKLNLSKAYNLFFNFEPLTVAGARAERREILALLTQVWEDDVDAGPKVGGEDAWPYLTVAECEGAGYAMSLRPEDRGAVCFYDKTLYPIVELASLEECVYQLWRGVVRGEDTTAGHFVDHTPDFDLWLMR